MEIHNSSSSQRVSPSETKEATQKSENNADEADLFDKATLVPRPAKVIYIPSREYEATKAILIHMQDNGDFKEFDKYSNNMLQICGKKGDFDTVAVVKIEQARCAIYRNDLNAARRHVREGHKLAEHTRFPPLFHAQAFLVMSNVSRNQNKLGNTKKYLDLAKQCLASGYSIEDLAHYYELYGSYLDKFLGICPKHDEQAKNLALTNFLKMGEIGTQDSEPRVSDKKQLYALIRIARILLDSNSLFGRKQRNVKENDIHLATECLEVIKHERLLDNMPCGTKIQYQMVESDLYYRKGNFGNAKGLLVKSLDEAKNFGYKTEEPKITQVVDYSLNSLRLSLVRGLKPLVTYPLNKVWLF